MEASDAYKWPNDAFPKYSGKSLADGNCESCHEWIARLVERMNTLAKRFGRPLDSLDDALILAANALCKDHASTVLRKCMLSHPDITLFSSLMALFAGCMESAAATYSTICDKISKIARLNDEGLQAVGNRVRRFV